MSYRKVRSLWRSLKCVSLGFFHIGYNSIDEMAKGVHDSIVCGEGRRFVAIFGELFVEGKLDAGLDACTLFADIGRITGDMEDRVSGTIVECGF